MQLIRPLLLLIVIAGLAGVGYMFWSKKQTAEPIVMSSSMSSAEGEEPAPTTEPTGIGGLIAKFKLPNLPQGVHLDTASLGTVAQQAQGQLGVLKDRGLEIKDHVGVVLGESQDASDESSLQERALEYGQYVYCKGVVEEWEAAKAQ